MNKLTMSILAPVTLVLALTACGGGGSSTATPPTTTNPTPTTPSQPAAIPSQYLPAAGFWDGKAASGPWCAGKTSTQSFSTQALNTPLLARPTAAMQQLKGLSSDLVGLKAQGLGQADLAVLLPTGQSAEQGLNALKGSDVAVKGAFGYWVVIRANSADAARLVNDGTVQYAERMPVLKLAALPAPNDATIQNQDKYLPMMNTQAAWNQLDTGCAHPVVAVIDTGWIGSTTHAEYNLVPKNAWYNAATNTQGDATPVSTVTGFDHGTAVAGVIAMTTNGYGKGAGVSYNLAKVLPISVMTAEGHIDGLSVLHAIDYATGSVTVDGKTFVNPFPASILNMSFGSDATLNPSQFFQSYFAAAAAKGVVIVAAAGNELGHGTTDTAALNYSIGVGGVMFDGNRWIDPYSPNFGSNYGPGVDVAAPAMAVGTVVDGKESYWTGTSMATPWVSAQVAMWMYANEQYRPDGSRTQGLTGDALYSKLYACFSAIGSNHGSKDEYLGYGKLDTARLVSPSETACR